MRQVQRGFNYWDILSDFKCFFTELIHDKDKPSELNLQALYSFEEKNTCVTMF